MFRMFFIIKERDYFGGRTLLVSTKAEDGSKQNTSISPSQLAVVADSADVEILLMDRTQMQFFPEAI